MKKAIIIAVILVALLSLPSCAGQVKSASTDALFETELFDLVNQARIEEGLSELTCDPALYDIALEYCQEMQESENFSHDGFDARADEVRDCGYTLIGENLARNFDDAGLLLEAWLSSSTHQEMIMNPLFFYTGLACYNGYTCQIFGGYDLEPFLTPLGLGR